MSTMTIAAAAINSWRVVSLRAGALLLAKGSAGSMVVNSVSGGAAAGTSRLQNRQRIAASWISSAQNGQRFN